MKRLAVLPFLALGLLLPPAARSGQPPAETKAAGDETPAGYQVRVITSGTAPIKLSGASRIHLRGGPGVTRTGPGKTTNGLQLEGCSNILVTDITFRNWYCGVKAQNSNNIEARNVICTSNRQQGWLFTNGKQITLRACEGSKTGGTSKSQHGAYWGCWDRGFTRDILCEDCSFYGSRLAEAQVNAESASQPAQGVIFRRCKITNDVFAVNLLSTQQFIFDACTITSKKKALSLDRSYGKQWPSTGVSQNGTTIVGKTYMGTGSKLTKLP